MTGHRHSDRLDMVDEYRHGDLWDDTLLAQGQDERVLLSHHQQMVVEEVGRVLESNIAQARHVHREEKSIELCLE